MTLLTVPTDVNIIRETVDYFRKLGFSEQYVADIESDLMQQQSKVMELLNNANLDREINASLNK